MRKMISHEIISPRRQSDCDWGPVACMKVARKQSIVEHVYEQFSLTCLGRSIKMAVLSVVYFETK